MPLFISDEDFATLTTPISVADKADAYIRVIKSELETAKAAADAASLTTDQQCSFLEQKFISLSSDYSALESRASHLDSSLQNQASVLASAQADNHQLHLRLIEKDGEIERLSTEITEHHKSKRQLLELVGMKDAEISEKNSTLKSYFDKITELSDRAAQREARLSELEAELVRCKSSCDKLSQEKELIEKHNSWLNSELTEKVNSLSEQRKRSSEIEADLSAKLSDFEKQCNECSSSLSRQKERARELESKLESTHRELCSAKDEAAAAEQRYSAEISTMSKLVELYKESSDEYSKKAGELEGVIKALETHLSQVESDYKDKLQMEIAAKLEAEKACAELREKLAKCEAELEGSRKTNELDVLQLSSFTTQALMQTSDPNNVAGDTLALVPHVPTGVSGTALAASLLREGWSLAKMYAKYQEAADALRHEQLGRKQTEAILERVLFEIEEKASVIMDERAEHERMNEAYDLMNQKLQQSLSEQANLEKVIRESKAELKRREREYNYAQKEITDLQKQVAILLKECRDIQMRCGSISYEYSDDDLGAQVIEAGDESDVQKVISENLLSIKDIKGLVEQNAKLRSLVRSLSDEIEARNSQLKEQLEEELQKHKEEASSKVAVVMERAEEQARMIESLHSSVAMYRRLYEEEHRLRSSQPSPAVAPSIDGRNDFMLLLEGSQDVSKKVQEQAAERVRCLEEGLAAQKMELISLRSERDKLAMEANFAQEKLERFMKEFDQQRGEMNGVLARNIEFSQLIVDYQKKVRESSESLGNAEELSRKLNMEVSILKREKQLLTNSEKRALDEVQELSQRVYRLQATLDTIQNAEQVREEARAAERRKQDDYIKQIEREWAEAKKELQEERNNVRSLSLDRENTIKDAMRQVEDMGKKLTDALQAVTVAEAKAAAAEARLSELERTERTLKSNELISSEREGGSRPSSSLIAEVTGDLRMAKQEIERLKAEAQANKEHMLQYKSIAAVNEAALKQMEGAYDNFKIEAEQSKKSLEAEIQSLRDRIYELENVSSLKFQEAASAALQKDETLASAMAEITNLKEETSIKVAQVAALEVQVSVMKEDLEREHERARAAQANYERQVILQSETIQELTKTSQALASLQEEASTLRRSVDAYKSENNELKSKWDVEKLELEKSKNEAEKKYEELNEQNRILHSQLEAMHIKLAEKDCNSVGVTSSSSDVDSQTESGLQRVVSYLRRSKEIAETEISLLKQEKLRLQSQLERALKAAEAAEASLSAERSNSRNLLFTEDEFKTLKLQVSEMNLLRESNMQLREENRYNFDECQKLREVAQNARVEAENLQKLLKERELEAESLRKQYESQKSEKEHLERRISEIQDKSKNVDIEEYNRFKCEIEQMQATMKEKDSAIEELRKQVSEKEEVIAKLEQDLSRTKSEFTDRESKLSLLLERQKKSFVTPRKLESLTKENRSLSQEKESLLKEKDSLAKENEALSKERDMMSREKECLLKDREVLHKEKEELGKDKQVVVKQLEVLRQEKEKKLIGDEPAVRDKEKEKDARIQSLETTVGRLREDSKKKEDRRLKFEKAILEKVQLVNQERKKLENAHVKHKEAVKKFSEEIEKLKLEKESLPEGASVIQLLSGSNLDDLVSTYVMAIENFEKEALLILNDVGNQASVVNSSVMDAGASVTSTREGLTSEALMTTPSSAPHPPVKASGEREKKISSLKANLETRKTGRKLNRPRLGKPEQQRDVEMSELDASKSVGKSSLAQETIPSTVPVTVEPSVRKRPASPSAYELREGSLQPGVSGSDLFAPAVKRSKGSETIQEDVQGQSADSETIETIPTVEELLDAAVAIPQSTEHVTDFAKDDYEASQGQGREPGDVQQAHEASLADLQRDDDMIDEELADKPSEADPMQDVDGEDKEEGEFAPEGLDLDGGDDGGEVIGSQDVNEVQPEVSADASLPIPAQMDDIPSNDSVDVNEMDTPDNFAATELNEEGEIVEEVAEVSEKSSDGNDITVGGADHGSEAEFGSADSNMPAAVGSTVSKEDSPTTPAVTDASQPPQVRTASTTINLTARARERQAERLGVGRSPATPTPSAARRERGGPLTRNRAGRIVRGGRRQTPGE